VIDHDLAIARLKVLGLFKSVGSAADAARAMSGQLAIGDGPAAYVVPIADHPAPPRSEGGAQAAVVTFGVLMMVRQASDPSGVGGLEKIKQLQAALHAGLLGWDGLPGFTPIWSAGGHVLEFQPAALWWLEEFSTNTGIAPAF
jgi:hypothetical protein